MKSVLLLLTLSLIVLSAPMSARGDTQPAPDQTVASDKDVASDMGIQKVQVAITRIHKAVDTVIIITMKPVQVALVMIGKPLNVALQMIDRPRTKVALTKIHRLASAEPFDIICEI